MEVHAHTHTPRKKWTHYFWEFLMLFLAVTLGFFVENQREHYVERNRAKEYAKALVKDLANDTTEILDVMREVRIVLTCFDSINVAIQKGLKPNMVPGSFYHYCNIGTASPGVVWNNTTLTQITQSGSLRYFNNQELVKKISSYYSLSNYISNLNTSDRNYREKSAELRSRLLNNYVYSRYSRYFITNWLNINDSLIHVRLPLQSYETGLLNEFGNSCENRRPLLITLTQNIYPSVLKAANELMELLKKKYHLE